jgi:hypothetical protein
VRVRRTRHQDLFSRDQDGHVWTQILLQRLCCCQVNFKTLDVLFSFSWLFLSNELLDFRSFFRFFHNQWSKESLFAHMVEDLKAYANVWANKFVDTNLRPHFVSWLLQLEDTYPEELPKLTACLEKMPFTAMGVTKNYVYAAHTDRDVLHSVISWFIRDIFTSHLFSLFFSFYQFCFMFIVCLCDHMQGTWPMWGNLFSLVLACFSDLDRGPCSF